MVVCVICVGVVGNVWVKYLRVWLMEGKVFSMAYLMDALGFGRWKKGYVMGVPREVKQL